MKTIDEIHRENLRTLISKFKSIRRLADALSISEAQISQWVNASKNSKTGRPRGVSLDSVRNIESILGIERGWMDNDHTDDGKANGLPLTFHLQFSPTALNVLRLMQNMDAEAQGAVFGAALVLSDPKIKDELLRKALKEPDQSSD